MSFRSLSRIGWLVLFGVSCYGFGALSVASDELYGIAQFYGPHATYFFPVIGGTDLWSAWIIVFSGLATSFFLAILSALALRESIR